MSEMSTSARIEVVSPGNRLTVQDLGRRGSQRYGVSVSGVLDLQAAVIANRLVGNPATTALLEATFGGVSIRFEQQTKVAITGAEVAVDIDRFPIPIWETVIVPAGTELSVSIPTDGLYTYIAIEGGVDVPRVLGSRSTHVASGLGGIGGRALKEGDILPLGKELEGPERPRAGTTAPADLVPACTESARRIRVIKGPQCDVFDNDAIATFFGSTFTVSNLTDRQGARLDGCRDSRNRRKTRYRFRSCVYGRRSSSGRRQTDSVARRPPTNRRLRQDRLGDIARSTRSRAKAPRF